MTVQYLWLRDVLDVCAQEKSNAADKLIRHVQELRYDSLGLFTFGAEKPPDYHGLLAFFHRSSPFGHSKTRLYHPV
jgi:hypothetical protein